jgi:hypothetical protein
MSELYLHIGSPKTGSTSIQEIFAHNRNVLEKQGYIYPGNNPDHHFLYFASEAPRNKWPRHFKGMDPKRLEAYIHKYFSGLEKDFKKKENVVMSTEYIFFDDERLVKKIFSYLEQFFSKIEVFVFIRGPVDYYKSYQQQLIKGQSYIQAPQSFQYKFKNVIEIWEPLCDHLEVLDFNKSKNSFKRLCEKLGISTEQLSNLDHRSKGSVSLEQMLMMEKIYKNLYSKYDDQLTGKLHVKTIAQINAPFTHQAKLKDWVKSTIYSNHQEDLHWLKEKSGIDFLSDYPAVDEFSDLPTFENGKATVRDIYKVEDEQSVEKYEALVVDSLLKKLVQGNRN